MSGDYSRETFNRKKNYSGVRMQQGRVQLDADWNEEHDIQNHRTETEAIDVIGQSGAPKKNGGFKIGTTLEQRDLTISAGRIYAGGLLLESDQPTTQPTTYINQPHLPNPEFSTPIVPAAGSPSGSARQLTLDDGNYLVFLDAWQREITALDDGLIREVALGGPDTTTRLQNVWQVKLLRVANPAVGAAGAAAPAELSCRSPFPEFVRLTTPGNGKLNARTQPPGADENPCLLPPSAGFSRQENQLYRVEIHTGGTRDQATFKFSRDNGSVETKIKKINDDVVTVSDPGKDEVLNFAGGQWVEIVDDESTLKGTPHPLVQIDAINPGTGEITLKSSVATLAKRSGLKLRRWDQAGVGAGANGVSVKLSNWVNLEGGIQVEFSAGDYRAGDYWLIPARTTTGEIEWPPYEIPNRNPVAQLPRGIRHHYCRLALIKSQRGLVSVIDDCRNLFPALTELINFFYVGGGGQEAMPGQRLPCPLRVGVTNDQFPVPGAQVEFKLLPPNAGKLHSGTNSGTTLTVETDGLGVAECELELAENVVQEIARGCLQVQARLVNPAGRFFEPSIRFNVNPSVAAQVAYDPRSCNRLGEARATTVQAAIDELCKQMPGKEPGIKIKRVMTIAGTQPLRNDRLLPVSEFARGLTIVCDSPISPASVGGSPAPSPKFPQSVPGRPTCFVTLDLPYPIGSDRGSWESTVGVGIIGYQPIILGGNVETSETEIIWKPTEAAFRWLQQLLFQRLQKETDRVLAHLTLKGNFIFSPDAKLFLDGEAFGRENRDGRVDVVLPSGDDRAGGDFEMWFWLIETPATLTGLVVTVTAVPGTAGTILRGTVRDNTGAIIAAVQQVTLSEPTTGAQKSTTTNAQGDFTFPNVTRGRYRLRVQVGEVFTEQEVNIT